VTGESTFRGDCGMCDGTGTFRGKQCPNCRGSGYIDKRLPIDGKAAPRRFDRPSRKPPANKS
jgi:DnaJ-class molecular chaperone